VLVVHSSLRESRIDRSQSALSRPSLVFAASTLIYVVYVSVKAVVARIVAMAAIALPRCRRLLGIARPPV
jgi:hypothetical protein